MPQFRVVLSVIAVMLLGIMAGGVPPVALAQDATPAAGEFTEEGITFEPLAFATALALPATGELAVSRLSFDPGAGFPIEEGIPRMRWRSLRAAS